MGRWRRFAELATFRADFLTDFLVDFLAAEVWPLDAREAISPLAGFGDRALEDLLAALRAIWHSETKGTDPLS